MVRRTLRPYACFGSAWVAIGLGVLGCARSDRQARPAPSPNATARGQVTSAASAQPEARRLPPLTDSTWLESLPMPAGHAAVVSVPLGATDPRPVMVGMHGAGDRPEWACGGYRAATDAFPFILCPRGVSHGGTPEKYWSPGAARIEEDIASALAALRTRFGAHVAEGPLLYAGFSLGAMHGARVLADEPQLFSAALLIEGGFVELTPFVANSWSNGAGKRALLACGVPRCPVEFRNADKSLQAAGIETRVLDSRTGRHNLDGEMMKALRAALPWLVRDDPRWRGFISQRDAGM